MPLNSKTKKVGKLIMQSCLQAGFGPNEVMESCAIIAAALSVSIAKEDGISAIGLYDELCKYAFRKADATVGGPGFYAPNRSMLVALERKMN